MRIILFIRQGEHMSTLQSRLNFNYPHPLNVLLNRQKNNMAHRPVNRAHHYGFILYLYPYR
jgi:hypothetical protein